MAWQGAAAFRVIDPILVPGPLAVASALAEVARDGMLWRDAAYTLMRTLSGFALGVSIGVFIGIVTGLGGRLRHLVEPLLQILRPIPAVALIPVAIAWFGIGEFEKIAIVTWAAFFPVWVNTHSGTTAVPDEFAWTGRLLGASRSRLVLEVIVPSALPFLVTGARVALGLSFAATVVAEMSGASLGLGYKSFIYHAGFQRDKMLAMVLAIGMLGALIDRGYAVTIRTFFPWLTSSNQP
jgi:ABC-type nitrate/sulfonate/bicarbonate transport system permease component